MAAELIVEMKEFGSRRREQPSFRVSAPGLDLPGGGRMTLRSLISMVVVDQVAQFEQRMIDISRINFLSARQIDEGAAKGKVDMGGRPVETSVDVNAAIETAIQAYEDGLYYVFIDDVQYEKLDVEVSLRHESHLLFLRLVALAGG